MTTQQMDTVGAGRPLRVQGSAAIENEDTRAGPHRLRQVRFEQVRLLYDAGKTATAITGELGLSRKRVDKWIRLEALPERNAMAPTPGSPAHYQGHLFRRWAEGCTVVRRLFTEIQRLGFTGCYTHLSQFVSSWRRKTEETPGKIAADPMSPLAQDPATGRQMSPAFASSQGHCHARPDVRLRRGDPSHDMQVLEGCAG